MTHENSTSFLDTYFDYLPEDMQREIINRCYKPPAPKHCYGDMVVLTQQMQETIETIETIDAVSWADDTEPSNDASGVYCVMLNPTWRHERWTWEYLIRELKSDNSRYYTTEFIGSIEENENYYLRDYAFVLNENEMLHYNPETFTI